MPCLDDIELFLPNLRLGGYRVTSDADRRYNCIAWAVGDTERWWDPVNPNGYWPKGVERGESTDVIQAGLRTAGFESCEDGELEDGVEKIALFEHEGEFTHVARQLENGRWSSKLGKDCDIEHELMMVENVAGPWAAYRYGTVVAFMSRPRGSGR